jgi:hypothetical protein
MIIVILHKQEQNEYDHRGYLLSKAETIWVSHGINTETGQAVILPNEKWQDFQHNCTNIDGEWYIK